MEGKESPTPNNPNFDAIPGIAHQPSGNSDSNENLPPENIAGPSKRPAPSPESSPSFSVPLAQSTPARARSAPSLSPSPPHSPISPFSVPLGRCTPSTPLERQALEEIAAVTQSANEGDNIGPNADRRIVPIKEKVTENLFDLAQLQPALDDCTLASLHYNRVYEDVSYLDFIRSIRKRCDFFAFFVERGTGVRSLLHSCNRHATYCSCKRADHVYRVKTNERVNKRIDPNNVLTPAYDRVSA